MIKNTNISIKPLLAGSLLFLIITSCSRKISVDRLPNTLHFLLKDPLMRDISFEKNCNPFYIRITQGKRMENRYVLVGKSRNGQQVILLCNGEELTRMDEHQLRWASREKVSYIKETSRFPAGSGIPGSGGGGDSCWRQRKRPVDLLSIWLEDLQS